MYTRENTEVHLEQMGLTLEDRASGSCGVDIGRTMGASLVMSGGVSKIEGEMVASIKLHETEHGSLIGARLARGVRSRELEQDLERRAAELFALVRKAGPGPAGGGEGRDVEPGADDWDFSRTSAHAIRFESESPGAEVRVDGAYLCPTPCSRELSEGGHTVSLRLSRYADHDTSISVSAPAAISRKLVPQFGWITVTTEPPGLAVWLDGTRIGVSPVLRHEVDPGTHTVLVRDSRYRDAGKEGFRMDGNRHREFRFEPDARMGGIRVRAVDGKGDALAREVELDGRAVGMTPWAERVMVEAHRVSVGGQAREVEVAEDAVSEESFEVVVGGRGRGEARRQLGQHRPELPVGQSQPQRSRQPQLQPRLPPREVDPVGVVFSSFALFPACLLLLAPQASPPSPARSPANNPPPDLPHPSTRYTPPCPTPTPPPRSTHERNGPPIETDPSPRVRGSDTGPRAAAGHGAARYATMARSDSTHPASRGR